MDFKGQYYNERTFQVLIILFGLIGFFAGYVQQDFRLTFHFLAAGSSLAACICLPDWPCWNRHPVAWLEVEVPTEEEKKKGKKADKPKKAKAS